MTDPKARLAHQQATIATLEQLHEIDGHAYRREAAEVRKLRSEVFAEQEALLQAENRCRTESSEVAALNTLLREKAHGRGDGALAIFAPAKDDASEIAALKSRMAEEKYIAAEHARLRDAERMAEATEMAMLRSSLMQEEAAVRRLQREQGLSPAVVAQAYVTTAGEAASAFQTHRSLQSEEAQVTLGKEEACANEIRQLTAELENVRAEYVAAQRIIVSSERKFHQKELREASSGAQHIQGIEQECKQAHEFRALCGEEQREIARLRNEIVAASRDDAHKSSREITCLRGRLDEQEQEAAAQLERERRHVAARVIKAALAEEDAVVQRIHLEHTAQLKASMKEAATASVRAEALERTGELEAQILNDKDAEMTFLHNQLMEFVSKCSQKHGQLLALHSRVSDLEREREQALVEHMGAEEDIKLVRDAMQSSLSTERATLEKQQAKISKLESELSRGKVYARESQIQHDATLRQMRAQAETLEAHAATKLSKFEQQQEQSQVARRKAAEDVKHVSDSFNVALANKRKSVKAQESEVHQITAALSDSQSSLLASQMEYDAALRQAQSHIQDLEAEAATRVAALSAEVSTMSHRARFLEEAAADWFHYAEQQSKAISMAQMHAEEERLSKHHRAQLTAMTDEAAAQAESLSRVSLADAEMKSENVAQMTSLRNHTISLKRECNSANTQLDAVRRNVLELEHDREMAVAARDAAVEDAKKVMDALHVALQQEQMALESQRAKTRQFEASLSHSETQAFEEKNALDAELVCTRTQTDLAQANAATRLAQAKTEVTTMSQRARLLEEAAAEWCDWTEVRGWGSGRQHEHQIMLEHFERVRTDWLRKASEMESLVQKAAAVRTEADALHARNIALRSDLYREEAAAHQAQAMGASCRAAETAALRSALGEVRAEVAKTAAATKRAAEAGELLARYQLEAEVKTAEADDLAQRLRKQEAAREHVAPDDALQSRGGCGAATRTCPGSTQGASGDRGSPSVALPGRARATSSTGSPPALDLAHTSLEGGMWRHLDRAPNSSGGTGIRRDSQRRGASAGGTSPLAAGSRNLGSTTRFRGGESPQTPGGESRGSEGKSTAVGDSPLRSLPRQGSQADSPKTCMGSHAAALLAKAEDLQDEVQQFHAQRARSARSARSPSAKVAAAPASGAPRSPAKPNAGAMRRSGSNLAAPSRRTITR